MKKTKVKTKTNIKKAKVKKYKVHHLGIILAAVLLLEGILIGATTKADWQKGSEILDISTAVVETMQDTAVTFQPMLDVALGINEFYQQSATEMAELLDLSDADMTNEIIIVYSGVDNFYAQASHEMEKLLDLSDSISYFPSVAGASITAN
jgi:hypothetical protein